MTASAETRDRAALPLAADCCAPLLREPLTPGQAADLSRTLKALADPTRLRPQALHALAAILGRI